MADSIIKVTVGTVPKKGIWHCNVETSYDGELDVYSNSESYKLQFRFGSEAYAELHVAKDTPHGALLQSKAANRAEFLKVAYDVFLKHLKPHHLRMLLNDTYQRGLDYGALTQKAKIRTALGL